MARLFGRDFSREALLERVGNVSQVAGLRRVEAAEGPGKGVGLVECWTGSGLRFTVALDRGMDIPFAWFGGTPLGWHAPPGLKAPAFYEPEGLEWLWTFAGGLLTTCGLQHAGAPSDLPNDPHGLHGRISTTPADTISLETRWEGDDYVMRIHGTCREARVFGPYLTLERTITARLGESAFLIDDVVTNQGHVEQPHMILYHFNIGWPIVDDGARLLLKAREAVPRDAEAEKDADRWQTFHAPVAGYAERCYFITPEPAENGTVTAAVVNPALHGGHGLGVSLNYSNRVLPKFVEWKMMGQGHYVVGMEPANCLIYPRSRLVKEGLLPILAAGESRRYTIEVGAVSGREAIASLAARVGGS